VVFGENHGVNTPVELIRPEGLAIGCYCRQGVSNEARRYRKTCVERTPEDDKRDDCGKNGDNDTCDRIPIQ
jgi:hypothetical protein